MWVTMAAIKAAMIHIEHRTPRSAVSASTRIVAGYE